MHRANGRVFTVMLFPWQEILAGLERQQHAGPRSKKKRQPHQRMPGTDPQATGPSGLRGRSIRSALPSGKDVVFGMCFQDAEANPPTPVTLPVTLNS